jgi:hypothetical protein
MPSHLCRSWQQHCRPSDSTAFEDAGMSDTCSFCLAAVPVADWGVFLRAGVPGHPPPEGLHCQASQGAAQDAHPRRR